MKKILFLLIFSLLTFSVYSEKIRINVPKFSEDGTITETTYVKDYPSTYDDAIKPLLDNNLPLVGIDVNMGGGYTVPVVAIDLPAESFDGWTISALVDPSTFNPQQGSINIVYQGASGTAGNIYNAFQTEHSMLVLYYGGFGIMTGMWDA